MARIVQKNEIGVEVHRDVDAHDVSDFDAVGNRRDRPFVGL